MTVAREQEAVRFPTADDFGSVTTTADQKARALAYLASRDALDLAPMLGLGEVA